MPKDKDLKRLIRSRMEKTGESYTAARARILERDRPHVVPEAEYAELAGMSDEAVAAKTGHPWAWWVRRMDALDAWSLPHPEIVKLIRREFEITHWWAQTVTVTYERVRGLRDVGQRRGGGYDANKSKTYPVPVARLWAALADDTLRANWLPGVPWIVRTATEEKSMRLTWEDDRVVSLYLTAKGDSKSAVQVQQEGLPSAEARDEAKAAWGERLAALGKFLAEA